MPQMNKVGKVATTVRNKNDVISVVYHQTEVVRVENGIITLNHGGWKTFTTKARMNQASRQFGLGYYVFQKDGAWFVDYAGKTVPFNDRYTSALMLKQRRARVCK